MNVFFDFVNSHNLYYSLDETEKNHIESKVIEDWCNRIIDCYNEYKQSRFIKLIHTHKSINPKFKPILYDYICQQTNYNLQAQ